MSQATYNVIIAASFALSLTCSASAPPNLDSTLKIVNSTNIRELKHNFATEVKPGAVAYVYPADTTQSVQNSKRAAGSGQKPEDETMAVPKKLFGQQTNLKSAGQTGVDPSAVKEKLEVSPMTGKLETTKLKNTTKEAEYPKPTASATSGPHAQVNNTGQTGVAPAAIKEKVELPPMTGKLQTTTLENTTKKAESPKPTASPMPVPQAQGNHTADSENEKPECVSRVEFVDDDNNARLEVYNATKEEVEAMGYEVFDTLCKGDEDWDKISAGALASLCCGSG